MYAFAQAVNLCFLKDLLFIIQKLLNMNTWLDSDSAKQMSLIELVTYYRNIKPRLKNNEIRNVISNIHDRMSSPRQLKKICRIEKLTRKSEVSGGILRELIVNELSTSRSCL